MKALFLGLLLLTVPACASSTTLPDVPDASRSDAGKDAAGDTKGPDTAIADSGCGAGELRCVDKCVDVTSDSANCGMCGKACGTDSTCVGGACVCSGSKSSCADVCVDTNTDSNNCGACGKKCLPTDKCSEGKCQAACPTGESRCSGSCINTATDVNNCGACAKVCATGQSCIASACVCDFPTKSCSGTCVNVNFDVNNCGDCGKVCPSGLKGTAGCTSGSCVLTCSAGYGNCNDVVSDGCEAEFLTDNNNCGGCGVKCPTLTSACRSGSCQTCPSGTILCGGACVNRLTDPKNCGSCGNICSGSTPNCNAGTCVAMCPGGTTPCSGACTSTATDPNNCGTCGNKCSTGVCVSSTCLTCTSGTITKDIPFSSVSGWTTSGCCSPPPPNYLVANGTGDTVTGTFADEIPPGSVAKTITVKFGIEHACVATTNAMDFQLNGVSVGTWNSSKGPDCSCGNTAVGDASFSAPLSAYKAGMSNTVSIVHNDSGSCHEAITNPVGAPLSTAMRVVITYGCP
jgi:hypothetical protein